MKKNLLIFYFFILGCNIILCQPTFNLTEGITTCLVEQSGCSPSEVVPIGDPYLYEGECSIALNRYLSRAVDVGGLHSLLDPDRDLDVNNENTHRNEEKYCNMIKSFAELDIQMIQRAYYGGAQSEHRFYSDEIYYKLGEQVVKDINFIYDCMGKRRPIIQGMAYEWVNSSNFSNQWATRPIPTEFLKLYFSFYPEDSKNETIRNYYCSNPEGDCISNGKKFDGERIMGPSGPPANINNVEWRMWFLYQAFEQIKMGYKALHLGIYWSNDMAGNELGHLSKFTDVIRQFAKDQGTFVLLSGETPMQDVQGGLSAKVPGTDRFIFDFDSRAMRPRELTVPSTTGDGNDCSTPIDPSIVSDFNNSPCSGYDLNAVIDPCTINSFGGSSSGYSAHDPSCKLEQIPYTVHFDGFSAPIDAPNPSSGNSTLTYGFNDHNWFAMLPPECQSWWYNYFYCNRRDYHNGSGFVVIPGVINSQYNLSNHTQFFPPVTHNLLYENETLFNTIKENTLAIKKPEVKINEHKRIIGSSCDCNGMVAGPTKRYLKYKTCYEVNIKNGTEDCSSVYSVHIKKPDGSWMPQKLNSTNYKFCPDQLGTYQIAIRQDYLGDKVQYGETTITVNELEICQLVSGKCGNVPFNNDCDNKIVNVYFNNETNLFQLNYKTISNQVKTSQLFESLQFSNNVVDVINIQNQVIDVRKDSYQNFYIFYKEGTSIKVIKINKQGSLVWSTDIGQQIANIKITAIKEVPFGFEYQALISSNTSRIMKIDYDGNNTMLKQKVVNSPRSINFLTQNNKLTTWIETTTNYSSLFIKVNDSLSITKNLPVGVIVKSVIIDQQDNVIVSGEFKTVVTINGVTYNSTNVNSLIFIMLNIKGEITHVRTDISKQNLYLEGTSVNTTGDIAYWGSYSQVIEGIKDSCMFYDKINLLSGEENAIFRNRILKDSISVYLEAKPNPFSDKVELNIISNYEDKGKVHILDNLGRVIFSKDITLKEGDNVIDFNEEINFTSGIYSLIYRSERYNNSKVIRIVKI